MIMIMSRIAVRGDNYLKAVTPQPLGKLYSNFMCDFRRNLSFLKGLIAMETDASRVLIP